MYVIVEDDYIARVPPDKLSGDYESSVLDVAKSSIEGKLLDVVDDSSSVKKCFIVSVTEISMVGEGSIVHGDGGVYQTIHYKALGYEPNLQEVVEGIVVSVQKFGAFVRFGPFDGLLHISQIMDDRIDLDLNNQRFIGKDTKRDLKINDKVRVRIVAMNLSSSSLEDSKIGLTMKQTGLGKLEWLVQKKNEA
ncbi:MAG: DNA-directed RNA polymerase [Candidatus Thermoplasmatota archaeon]|jgi:DNA-directed RNA polymerase subunit E'|nr:DNA-directed RNA polymerase [Candidatus Thermoplasmatota archaeon]